MEYFFKLERKTNIYNITNKKSIKYLNSEIINKYNNIKSSLNKQHNKDIKYVLERFNKITVKNQYYLWYLLDFDISNSYNILSREFDSEFYITKIINNGNNIEIVGDVKVIQDKYKNILYNAQSKYLNEKLKNYDLCKKEELLFNNKLSIISLLFDYLQKDGNFFLSIHGFCNDEIIEIYYILSFMFDYCIVYNSTYILCIHR
jgi:hypothetical protein